MKNTILLALLLAAFGGCVSDPEVAPEPLKVLGLRPIYVEESQARAISADVPQPISKLGKIYYKDHKIYVNESNYGVHVIDNTDPYNPVKTGFLRIPGCHDIAIKGNILYADNVGDLVAIDISDPANPVVTKRLSGLQGNPDLKYPQFYEGYFECVDESKGTVIGWEETQLTDPKCWR